MRKKIQPLKFLSKEFLSNTPAADPGCRGLAQKPLCQVSLNKAEWWPQVWGLGFGV